MSNANIFTILPPSIDEYFPTELNIVDRLILVQGDNNLNYLYNLLAKYQHHVFQNNERLLIFDCDTDYYPSMDSAGNAMFNLIQVIAELDVSTAHITILTNTIGRQQEVNHLCSLANIAPPKVINFSLWYVYPEQLDEVHSVAHKEFLYVCLNGLTRAHRSTIVGLLYQNNLIDSGMVSYQNVPGKPFSYAGQQTLIDQLPVTLNNRILRVTQPFSRNNDDLSLDSRSKQLHVKFAQELAHHQAHPSIVGSPNSNKPGSFIPFMQKALVYIITETVGDYPYPWFSEKTWKSMANKMPFMTVGPQHTLKTLQSFGFKTFSNFWNEGYDNLPNVYDRAEGVVNNLLALKDSNWDQLYQEMLPILEHNYNHLTTFREQELNKIKSLL